MEPPQKKRKCMPSDDTILLNGLLVRPPAPVLRLRPTAPTESIKPRQWMKERDGPWIAHPGLIDESERHDTGSYRPDITMDQYRELWRAETEEIKKALKTATDFEIRTLTEIHAPADMQRMRAMGMTDDEITLSVERTYVGAHQYLYPGRLMPSMFVDRFGADWRDNARGIYYRHYYSPGWVAADRSLWLPSLRDDDNGVDMDWDCPGEESRRARARTFLKHALDNERWKKAEYAWEADAWTDVFGLMRDDPLLTANKHEYNTMGKKVHAASCVLNGETKLLVRKPDATFGLATSQPRDYQRGAVGDWDLDHDRLEALLVHRHCGLISDPRWGDANLVFPFAAYEAKGWDGDPREARRQACSAGAVYLDMLERLSRHPGKVGDKKSDAYQTPGSRNTQVFVFTSFGAHWHILVGYKRPRLKREHAGREGMSDSVYVFQRIWSARVVTERKAWELLSLVDQIHLWGVTDHRDFVIRHLKPWHMFAEKCYAHDVNWIHHKLDSLEKPRYGIDPKTGQRQWLVSTACQRLPDWTKHLSGDFVARQKHLEQRCAFHIQEACIRYQSETGVRTDDVSNKVLVCAIEGCGTVEDPGYPLGSWEEWVTHVREAHGGQLPSTGGVDIGDHPAAGEGEGHSLAMAAAARLDLMSDWNSSLSTPRGARKRRREVVA